MELPEKRFRGWQYIYNHEPWGDRRQDYLFGMLAAVIANIHRGDNKQAYKASDFMQDWDGYYQPAERAGGLQAEFDNLKMHLESYRRQRELKQVN
jgi:hypothetical protein